LPRDVETRLGTEQRHQAAAHQRIFCNYGNAQEFGQTTDLRPVRRL